MASEAELTLILRARNLAGGAVDDLHDKVKKAGDAAHESSGRFGALGDVFDLIPFGRIARGFLDLILNTKEARDIAGALGAELGKVLAPIMAVVANFVQNRVIPAIRTVASAVRDWIANNRPLITQVGNFVSGALTRFFGMLGDVIGKIGDLVGWLWGGGKGPLALAVSGIAGVFQNVLIPVWQQVIGLVQTLFGWLGDVIGRIQSAIDWINSLNLVTQHTAQESIAYHTGQRPPGSASGGWVGLDGPEIRLLGERGPEFVSSTSKLNRQQDANGGVVLVPVSKRDIARAVDEELFFVVRRAPATAGRV